MEIKLYHIDTLEYSGSIVARNAFDYEFRDVSDTHFISMTRGMPLKALLANLVSFDLVYDVIDGGAVTCAE
ncbi:MAG: hypothetical protein MUC76_09510 [Spirochaetes bacterium]|jgi:hypothetical protein|nr:hypothetical protein [Spirochaetota bacterium]